MDTPTYFVLFCQDRKNIQTHQFHGINMILKIHDAWGEIKALSTKKATEANQQIGECLKNMIEQQQQFDEGLRVKIY